MSHAEISLSCSHGGMGRLDISLDEGAGLALISVSGGVTAAQCFVGTESIDEIIAVLTELRDLTID